jgi:hypothetical protein
MIKCGLQLQSVISEPANKMFMFQANNNQKRSET